VIQPLTDGTPSWLRTIGEPEGAKRTATALLVAALAHASLVAVAVALEQGPPAPALVSVTEVELQMPAAISPPPPPAPEGPPTPEPAAPAARAARTHAPKAAAPAPAAAAPLRTIDDAVKTAEEPVRFVTDPSGSAFGYGTVARGGTGTGAPGAQLPDGPDAPVSGAGGKSAAPELSRPPSLRELDPCRGFFPERAQADRGEVSLKVRVEADGKVRSVAIAREVPAAQGFGSAARDCLMSKHFSPALDESGLPVAVLSPVTIRFSR
jgi:outer membrane biosynthesis protein TonB